MCLKLKKHLYKQYLCMCMCVYVCVCVCVVFRGMMGESQVIEYHIILPYIWYVILSPFAILGSAGFTEIKLKYNRYKNLKPHSLWLNSISYKQKCV